MSRTMYNTPVLQPIVSAVCQFCLAVRGWKLQGHPPTALKYVMIAAPHTSNWDFPLALAIAFVYRFEMHWMGKDSLFSGWRGPVMRWLGGIPINRASRNNVVAETIAAFNASERLIIAIPPEGTRSKVENWKTGFYYIAMGANVPIGLAFLDYQRKVGGFLSTFFPTGDIGKDMAEIRACYAGISGKYAKQCMID